MPKKYRIAVIGHTGRGNYGHGIDRMWLELPQCEIVGVADAHAAGLRAAVERGIHVYMEKPFCRTLQEADQIVAACEKNNAKLAIAHQTRWSPKLQTIHDLLAQGAIGDILEMRGRGKEDARGGGEDLWVLGSHIMNLIHHFGGEPNWCFASVLQDGKPVTKEDVAPGNEGIGLLAGDTINAMYGLADGVTAYFGSHRYAGGFGAQTTKPGRRFALQIFGTQGIIEVLTGHLPPGPHPPGHALVARAQRQALDAGQFGRHRQGRAACRWRIARRQLVGLPGFDRSDRRRPPAGVQRLGSPNHGGDDRRRVRVPPPWRPGHLPIEESQEPSGIALVSLPCGTSRPLALAFMESGK